MKKRELIIGIICVLLPALGGVSLNAEEKPSVEWSLRKLEPICPSCSATVEVKSTKCFKCQKEFNWSEPTFDNTPEEALAKFRYALKYKNESMLKESVVQEKLDEVIYWLKEPPDKANEFINAIPLKSETKKNETAISVLQPASPSGGKIKESYNPFKVKMTKEDEQWKVIPEMNKVSVSSSRLVANETSAMGGCKTFLAANATWRQMDADGNGKRDYWTYDISSLYRMMQGESSRQIIPFDLAKADANPAKDDIFGKGKIQSWEPIKSTLGPKSGYLFKALTFDESGKSYNQNPLNGVAAANDFKFGFCAFPSEYGITGFRTFIINERGFLYAKDMGLPPETKRAKKTPDKLSAEEEKKIIDLIGKLGVEEWKEREAAQEALIKIGKPTRELLEKAKDTEDPEVRMRINTILNNEVFSDKVIIPGGVDRWPGADPTTQGWATTGD